MPRLKRFLMLFPLFLGGVVALALAALFTCYPKVDPADAREVARDDERVARGAYLAEHVAACTTCHSQRDWSAWGGPPKPGTQGAGGEVFDHTIGLPGVFVAPNLTPTGIGDWSDGEIARAVRAGVDAHGEPLMPIMPYLSFAGLCREDTDAIVAYLRSLEAKPDAIGTPERSLDFPLPLLIRTFPQSGEAPPCVLPTDAAELRGGYLARAAGCGNCHTPMKEGRPVLDKSFSGGSEFIVPGEAMRVHAANITPDPRTGIGEWSEADFVAAFAKFRDPAALALEDPKRNTNMPWAAYAHMSDDDLAAIYAFLRSQPPVGNRVRGQTQGNAEAP